MARLVGWNGSRSVFLYGGGYDWGTDWKGRWNFAGNTGNGLETMGGHVACYI